jgi:predicted transcriptional regulator
METSILESVVSNLIASRSHWEEIAEASGVPFGTLRKIGWRQTKNPRFDTVEKLAVYFRENPIKKKPRAA